MSDYKAEMRRRRWQQWKDATWAFDYLFMATIVGGGWFAWYRPAHGVTVALVLSGIALQGYVENIRATMRRNELLSEVHELRDENKRLKKSLEVRP